MGWVQFFGLLVPLIALFGFLYRELRDWRAETRAETTEIRKGFQEEMQGFRQEMQGFREEIRVQSQRSDRLYEMFIALLEKQIPNVRP